MSLRFHKYEGTANDFIVVDASEVEGAALSASEVRRLCDRHRGIGADGVLLLSVRNGHPAMDVLNADGSTSEMCGNGLRCVARHLVRTGRASNDFVVETGAGPHRCVVVGDDIEIRMRVPSLEPSRVPVLADGPLRDTPLRFEDDEVRLTAVSMGNPHAVTFDEGLDRLALGPRIGRDGRFPEGVNVGFGRFEGDELVLDVFERGAGWTQACGTGACAAVVAAVETGRAARSVPVRVRLPGGVLTVTVEGPDVGVLMRGPARFVFDGVAPRDRPVEVAG